MVHNRCYETCLIDCLYKINSSIKKSDLFPDVHQAMKNGVNDTAMAWAKCLLYKGRNLHEYDSCFTQAKKKCKDCKRLALLPNSFNDSYTEVLYGCTQWNHNSASYKRVSLFKDNVFQ